MKQGLCFITKCTQRSRSFRLNHFVKGKTCIFLHVYKIILLAHLLAPLQTDILLLFFVRTFSFGSSTYANSFDLSRLQSLLHHQQLQLHVSIHSYIEYLNSYMQHLYKGILIARVQSLVHKIFGFNEPFDYQSDFFSLNVISQQLK